MMMTNTLNRDQAQALATLVHTIRTDWDAQGVFSALAKARDMGSVPEVVNAAVRAALDTTNRTPAVIAHHGPHWAAPPATKTKQAPCPIHGGQTLGWNCNLCRSDHLTTGHWPPGTHHHQATRSTT